MINGRKLNENISPNQRRLRLKELSGQKLTEREKQQLKRKVNEVVSMVEPTKYHNRTSPTGRLMKTFGNNSEEEDLDQEIELEEILREMGYYDDDEIDIGDTEEEDIREYVREKIRENFLTELELQEIIDELEDEL